MSKKTVCDICKKKKKGVKVGPLDGYLYCPKCVKEAKEVEREKYALFDRFGSGTAILV